MHGLIALSTEAPWQAIVIAIAALGEFLAILFVYRVLVRGGSPASTVLWMAVILAAPWLGLLLYYLLPRRLQLRRLKRLAVRGSRLRSVRGNSRRRSVAGGGAVAERGLRALFASTDGAFLDAGNDVRWLPSGEDFFAAAAEAIRTARAEIHCVVYIFRPDAAGLRFLDLLTAAAQRGVAVRLLYDSFGSFGLKASALAGLRAAGGRAEAFLPLLWKRRPFTVNLRNHRKLLVVDGEVGFVGGRNVGDEYFTDRVGRTRRWLDAMVEIRGPAVGPLQDVFVQDWCTATDEVLDAAMRPAPPSPAAPGGCRVGIACSGPDREHSDLWFAVIQAIGEAETSIELSSPYLVPPPMLLFALQLAAARGVRVRIHTNGPKAEAAVLYHAQRSCYERLLDAGIELYETVDDYNHSKLLVVDARTVVVGSANMDLRSANLNFEIAAVVLDNRDLAARVLATVGQRQAGCRRLTAADLPQQPWWRAIDGFCGLLSPLL
jgi:cardiolipin synthase